MTLIKLTKEQSDFLKMIGHVVTTRSGNCYVKIPYWYRITDNPEIVEEINFESIPDDLKDALISNRTKNE